MRVCVGTVVHHPEDARIMHRQIRALLAAGHEVTYIAPFTDCNVTPPPEIRAIDVPRAVGRRRGRALRAAWSALRRGVRDADVLLVHDLELLLVLPPERRRPPTVWDVHEDAAGALDDRPDLPGFARRPLHALTRWLEDQAERRLRLILAEESLSERFPGGHPVVPDTTYVPPVPPAPPKDRRVVYVGRLSHTRGAADMIELARRLAPHGIRLDLIGPADPPTRALLRDAQRTGLLDWYGHVPNRHALRMAEGALAGLSLLHDAPHHRRSLPAKVIEYMAHGVPVVTTPLPMAASLVGRVDCGVIVPFGDVAAAARAVLRLKDDPERRAAMGARGYAEALHHFHWPDHATEFVGYLERLAATPATVSAHHGKTRLNADHGDGPAGTPAAGPHLPTPMTHSRPA
ncbi:glycosyltransferase [Thermopolyspora sp. NPDC052614]|uniref:glycosyltransferase family 4 protein n=1 Tax=Thermopolyspora sp. NPDC052614 TaxID=3155682 RepID=UPI00341CC690